MNLQPQTLLYEGKAKKVYSTQVPRFLIVSYKDDTTAFNGEKKEVIAGKGTLNHQISNLLMQVLQRNGIPTHFIATQNERESVIKHLKMFALEVIVRNFSAGSLTKRLGIAEGKEFASAILEFCYKNDALGDPMINTDHILVLNLATQDQIQIISSLALQINTLLKTYFLELGILLVDFKLEFGIDTEGQIVLGDEISPDTCRFWDCKTRQKLDKDLFRQDLGGLYESYRLVLDKILTKENNG